MAFRRILKLTGYGVGAWGAYAGTTCTYVWATEKMNKYNAFSTGKDVLKGQDLSSKSAILTGASAGLGKQTTKDLVRAGCKVYMACRNIEKANKAKLDIIKELKSEGLTNKDLENAMEILQIDLGNLQSVNNFAKTVKSQNIKPDYLINNAGVMAIPEYWTTKNDIEFQFGVNHIGHFYMTTLLLPVLKEKKTRIVNLSSIGHQFAEYEKTKALFKDCIQAKSFMGDNKSDYTPFYNYGISKSSNILFTRELNKRYNKDGIISLALHPGGIQTELGRDMKLSIFDAEVRNMIWWFIKKPWLAINDLKTVETGVSNTIRCATIPEKELKASKYRYYVNCNPEAPKSHSAARYGNNELESDLWQLSELLIKEKGFKLEL